MRVLVAEDERITQRSLERSLQQWGHDVECVADGAQAWETYQSTDFDAVISDWQMPRVDGLELVRRIRDQPAGRYTYVILLTSKSETQDLVAALDTGADDFLTKPFDRSELRARLTAGERIVELERRLAHHNEQMRTDLDSASRYVRSLLPPPTDSPVAVDWRFTPATDLAGDCLGYHDVDEDHFAFYVLDVTGHGLDAALLSVTMLNVLRSMSLPGVDFRDPAEVLGSLNDTFPMEEHGDRCSTVWYGVYHRQRRKLKWAGAGHPPALLFTEERMQAPLRLESTGPMIGMLPDWDGQTVEAEVPGGAAIYVFSDGVYEIEQPDGSFGALGDFVSALSRFRSSPKSPLDELWNHAVSLGGRDVLEDDFTLMEVRC